MATGFGFLMPLDKNGRTIPSTIDEDGVLQPGFIPVTVVGERTFDHAHSGPDALPHTAGETQSNTIRFEITEPVTPELREFLDQWTEGECDERCG